MGDVRQDLYSPTETEVSTRVDTIPFDGKSLLPLLTGESKTHHEMLFWCKEAGEWAVRRGDWKLRSAGEQVELFNLAEDPSETTNLAGTQPGMVKTLSNDFDAWIAPMPEPITGGPKRTDTVARTETKPKRRELVEREMKRERIRVERKKQRAAEKRAEKANEAEKENIKDRTRQPLKPDRAFKKDPAMPVSGEPPSTNFDLSHWKLTLPVDAAETSIGKAAEISAAQLAMCYKGAHFHTDTDWANQTFYFRAGAYPQDNEGQASEGARSIFSELNASHLYTVQ